ncbi:MAG: hypothetical protein Q8R37_05135 [Nanoarchaeota archaeon]|nr:hypothetical protein [Nanoarchaeota archaeon]
MLVEIIGWVGVIAVLAAYLLLTHHDLTSRSKIYHWMNFSGAILLGTHAYINKTYPFFVINIIWTLVSIYGLWKGYKK